MVVATGSGYTCIVFVFDMNEYVLGGDVPPSKADTKYVSVPIDGVKDPNETVFPFTFPKPLALILIALIFVNVPAPEQPTPTIDLEQSIVVGIVFEPY